MKVESIHIEGFRSLSDLTFTLGAFTTLVGPNNAGKSNIVDALGFLADVYAHGIRQALDLRGGFENVAFRDAGGPRRELRFEVVVSAEPKEIYGFPSTRPLPDVSGYDWLLESGKIQFTHRFVLLGKGDPLISDIRVEEEQVQIDQLGDPASPALRVARRGVDAVIELSPSKRLTDVVFPFFPEGTLRSQFLERAMTTEDRPGELVVDRLGSLSPAISLFLNHLGRMKSYQLLPTTCRIPSSATPTVDLGRHGENLAAFVYDLKGKFPETWNLVMQDMELIFQNLTDVVVEPTTDRRWTLLFKEGEMGRQWTANEVSDGTIRALALFSTVYDPLGSLLAIEEPENSLHTWILQMLVEACRMVSVGENAKQIVLTTHSPVLIDRLFPSEVLVVWKEQGQTRLMPLLEMEPGIEESWSEGKIKLSGLLDSGLLRQTVPVPLG